MAVTSQCPPGHPYECKDIPYKIHLPHLKKTLRYFKPRTREELRQILKAAQKSSSKVYVTSGHPDVNRCVCSSDYVVSLQDLEKEITVDSKTKTVTVGVAVSLTALSQMGLSLPSQDINAEMTVGEALISCMHAPGFNMGILPSYVEEMEVMTSAGELLRVTRGAESELFRTLGMGLGLVCVILTVTMTAIQTLEMTVNQYPINPHQLLEYFEVHCSASSYFSFTWLPNGGCVSRYCRKDTQEPKRLGNGILRNLMYEICETAIFWMSRLFGSQRLLNTANRLLFYLGYSKEITFKTDSKTVHLFPNTARYYTEEWFAPRNLLALLLMELEALITDGKRPVHRVDVSLVRPDDLYLSPTQGRDSVSICVSVSRAIPRAVAYATVFHPIDHLLQQEDAQLSWHTYLHKDHRAKYYPGYDDFCRVRNRLDPSHTLVSPHLPTHR